MKKTLTPFFHIGKVSLFILLFSIKALFAGTNNDSTFQYHEITIYVITSTGDINWSNPSDLFKSMNVCFFNAALQKNYYVIRHAQARIISSSLPDTLFTAMTSIDKSENANAVLVKKVGFGTLGLNVRGKIEPENEIKRSLELYSKRNKVAYVKFIINEEAVRRILKFINYYGKVNENGFSPSNYYNGALYPRFENEGAGCSAYSMTLLDVANVLPPESIHWMVDIRIPMYLIGGEFNNNKKVNFSDILQDKTWYSGDGIENVDFLHFKIYDPSIIYKWIMKKYAENDIDFQVDNENGIKGLKADRHNVTFDLNDSILKHRTDTNLFVKQYYKKIQGFIKQ